MNYKQLTKLVFTTLLTILLGACSVGGDEPAEPQDALFTGVNFVGVSVSNMDRSVDFYSKAVNLVPVESKTTLDSSILAKLAGRSDEQAQAQIMKSTNAQLLFMEFADQSDSGKQPDKMDVYGPGIAHVCYQVNEDTQSYQRFLDAGASHIGDPNMVQLNPKNPVKYAYARDLDGAIFEVEHVDVKALNLPEPPKNDYRIRHVSLATPDMDRLVEFYSTLLKQDKPRRVGRFLKLSGEKLDRVSGLPGSKVEMAWFQIRNLELELIQYHSHPAEHLAQPSALDALGYNMIVLDVKDLGEARERFIEAGGEIVSDVETTFGGEVLFGRDPDGNLLGMQVVDSSNVMSSQNFLDNGT